MIAYELSCRYSDTLYYRSGENTVEEFDGIITLCWKYSVVQAFSWNNEVDYGEKFEILSTHFWKGKDENCQCQISI